MHLPLAHKIVYNVFNKSNITISFNNCSLCRLQTCSHADCRDIHIRYNTTMYIDLCCAWNTNWITYMTLSITEIWLTCRILNRCLPALWWTYDYFQIQRIHFFDKAVSRHSKCDVQANFHFFVVDKNGYSTLRHSEGTGYYVFSQSMHTSNGDSYRQKRRHPWTRNL